MKNQSYTTEELIELFLSEKKKDIKKLELLISVLEKENWFFEEKKQLQKVLDKETESAKNNKKKC